MSYQYGDKMMNTNAVNGLGGVCPPPADRQPVAVGLAMLHERAMMRLAHLNSIYEKIIGPSPCEANGLKDSHPSFADMPQSILLTLDRIEKVTIQIEQRLFGC